MEAQDSTQVLIKRLSANAYLDLGADIRDIEKLEAELGRALPPDYKAVLLWSNGLSCLIGSFDLILWPVEQIYLCQKDYQIDYFTPDLIGIGSDGGPLCLAFDYRGRKNPTLVAVPFGDLDYDSVQYVADSLTDAASHWEAENSRD